MRIFVPSNNTKTNIMTYTFNTNTEKAQRDSVLEQCAELYTHKEFDFIVGGGSINGIKALCPSVQLFCICNDMKA